MLIYLISEFFASQGHFSSKTCTDLARGSELVSGPTTMLLQPKTRLLQTLIMKKTKENKNKTFQNIQKL